MLTSTITRHVAQLGNAEIEARIEFIAHPPCGDGRHEPREPAHAEVTDVTLVVKATHQLPDREGQIQLTAHSAACPAWLERLIIEDADCDLTYAVDELLADDADAADEAREFRRAAE